MLVILTKENKVLPGATIYEVPLHKSYVHTLFYKAHLTKTNKNQLSPNFEIVLLVATIAVEFSNLAAFTYARQYITPRFYMYVMT